jgi:hypothetical protein
MGRGYGNPYKRIEKKKILRVFTIEENKHMVGVKEIKSSLRKIILERDEEYYEEENVIYAKNAFLINSVLCWYFDRGEEMGLNVNQISSVLDLLDKHINKEVTLVWEDGNLQILSPKKENKVEEK